MASTDASNPWNGHTPTAEEESHDAESSAEEEEEEDEDFTYPASGDYSAHMEELFEGEEDGSVNGHKHGSDDDEEEEEGFLYSGVDADASIGYKDQLRDVLGQDHEEDEDDDVLEVERSLILENGNNSTVTQTDDDEPLQHTEEDFFERPPSASSLRTPSPESRVSSPDSRQYPFKLAKPFLHPTVSRLRSFTPQSSRVASNESSIASHSRLFDGTSPPPSHFSSISRMSSSSNLQSAASRGGTLLDTPRPEQEAFKWTDLNTITQMLYSKASQKASTLLGAPALGLPTVLAANGLICVGHSVGAVTALALSHDHTFVASGHATGFIQLYNLKTPRSPVRSVPPTTLAAVSSGRKEGHLQGSRIVSMGFVAGRHTAIVSADDHGLAFFHSLGKVLFVEASDILRILGRYPEVPHPSASLKTPLVSSSVPTFSPATDAPQRRRARFTVLSMAPLPLGTAPHPTDAYNVVALLTPTKLVVIGLKPTPRTWFKCPREIDEGGSWKSRSKWIGTLAWFPSVLAPSANGVASQAQNEKPTTPVLAFTWGSSLHLLNVQETRIKQVLKNSKTGKTADVDIGTVTYEKLNKWSAGDDVLALQWLNQNQIIVVTRSNLGVYDLKHSRLIEQIAFDGLSLAVPSEGPVDPDNDIVAHSLRVYKGKLFLLKRDKLMVGTLLTWADRILSLVENGDFLQAIDLTRSYYVDEAPGNRNNLPADPIQRKYVIGERLRELMEASAQYAFSEDRMTDETHITPDNRGVDRTSLFEGIVTVCCRASVALDDFEYLFEDLFQKYDDCGISSIYLRQLEPFVLDNSIRYVPPWITQRLVALHELENRPELVERIIWHMDPSCLDVSQAIQLCQRYHLYDALVYIYTRAIQDYVAPVVEFLGLIRKVQHFRKSRDEVLYRTGSVLDADASMESIIMNAYKIFPYLSNVLSGLTYPSEEPLEEEEAFQAKKKVYTFLFFGRSNVWPPGEGGKLILTSDEEGGIEPTYPYARQLLLFDSESFLHSLDIAFEDTYFNYESEGISRFIIVRIILDILSSGNLPQDDITMVNIFIARNVAKYKKFLFDQMPPTTLHNILIDLAEDRDTKTREDRQLAAEYLLSVYNPHDSERILSLFESAGFYRILRTWHYREQRWAKLLSAYIDDPDVTSLDLFIKVEEVISLSSRSGTNKVAIPPDLTTVVSDSLPRLLDADISATAHLIDRLIPNLHQVALESFGSDVNADKDRYEYLQSLLSPQQSNEEYGVGFKRTGPSENLSPELRQVFLTLQCRFHPENVIPTLQYLPKESLDLTDILETCEAQKVYDAVIWATNWQGEPQVSLSKADTYQKRVVREIIEAFASELEPLDVSRQLASLDAMAKVSRDICVEHSQGPSATDVPLEDMWFTLLNSQIRGVQIISASLPSKHLDSGEDLKAVSRIEEMETLLGSLRTLVQSTFGSLVSITSTSTVSFPRLFKRLVNSTPSSTGSHYTEFRTILTGMLESYHSDEDSLIMLKHLVDRDLFDTVAQVSRERACGWSASRGTCQYCRKPLMTTKSDKVNVASTVTGNYQIIVSRTGVVSHMHCRPHESISSA